MPSTTTTPRATTTSSAMTTPRIETTMTFYAGEARRLQQSVEAMNYRWAEKNMEVLTQTVAKTLDHPRDMLIVELLNTQGRRRLKASTPAFALRIIVLLTDALKNSAHSREHIERIQQKLLDSSDSCGKSGGLKAMIISELR